MPDTPTLKDTIEKLKTNSGGTKVEGYLTVTLKQASNLIVCDVTGKSDPYIYLAVGPSRQDYSKIYPKTGKSEIKKQTLNPVYNETFSLIVRDVANDYLLLEMWDYDKLSADDYMGDLNVKLSDTNILVDESVTFTRKLFNVASGAVEFSLSFEFQPLTTLNTFIDEYLSQYEFNATKLLNNDITRDLYLRFLAKNNKKSAGELISKIIEFKMLASTSDKFFKANQIVNYFNNVDVSANLKKEVLDAHKESSESKCNSSLFDDVLEEQVRALEKSQAEFLKSSEFLRALADEYVSLIPMIATPKSGTTEDLISMLKRAYGESYEQDVLIYRFKKELQK